MGLSSIIKEIGSSYGDIRAMAQAAAVSPKEVAAALAKAKVDTTEYVVLSLLAEYHPFVDTKPAVVQEE